MLIQPQVANPPIEATATTTPHYPVRMNHNREKILQHFLVANLLAGGGFSGMGFAGNSRPIFPAPTSLPNGVIFSLSPQIDPGSVHA